MNGPQRLLARLKRIQSEATRAAVPSRAVTRATAGIRTAADKAAFYADVTVDLLTGALTPKEARELTKAIDGAL